MIFKLLDRLGRIDQLIRQKRTGNAEEFAEKLNISRRQVYNWLDELKSYGLEIAYDRELRSFVYLKSYQINISFDIKELSKEEAIEIKAGVNILKKIVLCNEIAQTQNIFDYAILNELCRPVSSNLVCRAILPK